MTREQMTRQSMHCCCCLEAKEVGDPSFFGTELGHKGKAMQDAGKWVRWGKGKAVDGGDNKQIRG